MIFLVGEFKRSLCGGDEENFAAASYAVNVFEEACFVHDVYQRLNGQFFGDNLWHRMVNSSGVDLFRIRKILKVGVKRWIERREKAYALLNNAKDVLATLRGPGALPGVCLNPSDGCVAVVGRLCSLRCGMQ